MHTIRCDAVDLPAMTDSSIFFRSN